MNLVGFWGEDREGTVYLSWETSREINNSGFNIFRSLDEDDDFSLLTPEIINSDEGKYGFIDDRVAIGETYYYKLQSVNLSGSTTFFDAISVEVKAPRTYKLYDNFTNPFNQSTTIKFDVPKAGRVTLVIFNILGQEVKRLVDEELVSGFYEFLWRGDNQFGITVASGVYIYSLKTKDFIDIKKMLFVK